MAARQGLRARPAVAGLAPNALTTAGGQRARQLRRTGTPHRSETPRDPLGAGVTAHRRTNSTPSTPPFGLGPATTPAPAARDAMGRPPGTTRRTAPAGFTVRSSTGVAPPVDRHRNNTHTDYPDHLEDGASAPTENPSFEGQLPLARRYRSADCREPRLRSIACSERGSRPSGGHEQQRLLSMSFVAFSRSV